MKTKRHLVQVIEQNTLYRDSQILITREEEITTIQVNRFEFQTIDVFEAVAFILKNKKFDNLPFWKIEITEEDRHLVDPIRSLYWLSGGDEFWISNVDIKDTWSECHDLYYNHFSEIIYDGLEQSETFMDLRTFIVNNLNLNKFWDFALSKKIVSFC